MNSTIHFLDANIVMYAVGSEHPLKQPCLAILEAVATDRLIAATDVEVLQEILHRYTALGQRARASEVVNLFLRVVPDVLPVTVSDFSLVLQLHGKHDTLPVRDILHYSVMRQHGIEHIVTADRHFAGLPSIVRHDPADWPSWFPVTEGP